MNSNKRLSTKYTGIDKDIENLTANNMKDLQDRFSNIFKGDFPEDIRDLENIIVSAFVKKTLPEDVWDFVDFTKEVIVSYSGIKNVTFAVICVKYKEHLTIMTGISVKHDRDKNNQYVGMLLALMDCCLNVHLKITNS